MARFVPFDRDQPFLLPPDLTGWLPEEDLAHFIVAAARLANTPPEPDRLSTKSGEAAPAGTFWKVPIPLVSKSIAGLVGGGLGTGREKPVPPSA
jgi:hypothetical protein